jgi:hypothetical protein
MPSSHNVETMFVQHYSEKVNEMFTKTWLAERKAKIVSIAKSCMTCLEAFDQSGHENPIRFGSMDMSLVGASDPCITIRTSHISMSSNNCITVLVLTYSLASTINKTCSPLSFHSLITNWERSLGNACHGLQCSCLCSIRKHFLC